MATAFQISLQGIRIRLGRALVTLSGVVLGIAFFMSVLTGNLIKQATDKEEQLRQTVKMMDTIVKSEVGSVKDKTLAVAALGKVSAEEHELLKELISQKPRAINGYGIQMTGITPVNQLAGIGDKASLLLLMGDEKSCSTSYAELTTGMEQLVIIDSYKGKERVIQGDPGEVQHDYFSDQSADRMLDTVNTTVDSLEEHALAVVALGQLSDEEQKLLKLLVDEKPRAITGFNIQMDGITPVSELAGVGKDASLLLILGDGENSSTTYADLTKGMTQLQILDSYKWHLRQIAGDSGAVKQNQFFGDAFIKQQKELVKATEREKARTVWILVVSLLVTVIGITNALLMSVTERFKEIGTMKCLGALSSFIRQLFLIESALIGGVGSFLGAILGALIPILAYAIGFGWGKSWGYGFSLVFGSLNYPLLGLAMLVGLVVGTLLSILAAIYPAQMAAKMVPANALRSNV